jgi:hypothetical protein
VHTKVIQVIASVKRKNAANHYGFPKKKKQIQAWRERVQLEEKKHGCVEANQCYVQIFVQDK